MSRIQELPTEEKLDLTERLVRAAADLTGRDWLEEWDLFRTLLERRDWDWGGAIREYLTLIFTDLC